MPIERQMPQYRSHKTVWALKIKQIDRDIGRHCYVITPEDEGYGPIDVPYAYVEKHEPDSTGGYYVVYEDGYKSWSPSEAFEKGYTRI